MDVGNGKREQSCNGSAPLHPGLCNALEAKPERTGPVSSNAKAECSAGPTTLLHRLYMSKLAKARLPAVQPTQALSAYFSQCLGKGSPTAISKIFFCFPTEPDSLTQHWICTSHSRGAHRTSAIFHLRAGLCKSTSSHSKLEDVQKVRENARVASLALGIRSHSILLPAWFACCAGA